MITIAQYAIMRFAKQKGGFGALEAHHERTKEKYASNPDIDTAKSKYNFHIIKPETSYKRESDDRIAAAGCRTRKDSVRFVDTIITASPSFFKGKKSEEVKAFFQTAVEFLSQKIDRGNIFTAVVHMDEKTPHMHLCFTPITRDGRLSAKEIIGNRIQLTKWQDAFFEHMVKSFPNIERGESASKTGRRHIPTRVFKQAVRLTKQAAIITEAINNITMFNTTQKKEELIRMLRKFFPGMENFETQVKKHKREIDRLDKANAQLSEKVRVSEKRSIQEAIEQSKIAADYRNLQQFVASLPPEVVELAKHNQRIATLDR